MTVRRRTVIVAAVAAAAVAGGAVTVAVATGDDPPAGAGDGDQSGDDVGGDLELATVEQRDLARVVELDGTIGYGEPSAVPIGAAGTLTWLPEPGSVVTPGHTLLEVDGEPVLLMPGERPVWRALEPGMSKGEDIRQLEAALVELGFSTGDDLPVDDTWTSATTKAVKALQAINGMPVDGRLALGEIVFAPASVRIASVAGVLGDAASAAGIEVTGEQPSISVSLDAEDVDLLSPGDEVDVELPSGDRLPATVESIGSAQAAQDGSVTLPVTLTADGLAQLEGIPVEIEVAVVEAEGALAVPADALLALAEGGYAVELPDGSSPTGTRLVAVDVGVFADGWVQITGDVSPGDQVVVP
jgi:peptidoglycan hydrolase-like protein with peptidoglycan-binding domain